MIRSIPRQSTHASGSGTVLNAGGEPDDEIRDH
jgi:hypothetical protein